MSETKANARAEDQRVQVNTHRLGTDRGRAKRRGRIHVDIFDVEVQEGLGCDIARGARRGSAMLSNIGALLAVGALSSMSAANAMQISAHVEGIEVGMCGSPLTTTIPVDGSPPGSKRDCPAGCHAVCNRKFLVDPDDDPGA